MLGTKWQQLSPEVKATAMAKKQASMLEAIMHGAGDECQCVVKRYEVDAE